MKRLSLLAVAILLVAAGTTQGAEILLTNFQSAGYSQTINGAIFTNVNPQTTGTGFVGPFLKFTDNGPTEQAYNFDMANLPNAAGNDAFGSANFNRLLWSGNLSVTDVGGADYWTFVLDIDQAPGGNAYYSLDQLALFWNASATVNPGVGAYPAIPNLGTKFYDMDLGVTNCGSAPLPPCGDVALGLNYSLNNGSGSGDLQVRIPVPASLPAGGAYIYMYHAGGFYPDINYINNNGPDEWWAEEGATVVVPDGGVTAIMLGLGMLGLGVVRRFRR